MLETYKTGAFVHEWKLKRERKNERLEKGKCKADIFLMDDTFSKS